MPAVLVPTVVVLVILAAVGCTVANYAGMTIPEALDYAKNNHDYTCPDSVFESIYEDWHEVQDANKPITYQDIQTVIGMGNDLYNGAVSYTGNFVEYFLGSFDSSWTAEVSSRTIRIYDENTGELVGEMAIYGVVDGQIEYGTRTTPPALTNDKDGFYSFICFRTTQSNGTSYYHTSLPLMNSTLGGADRTYFDGYPFRFHFDDNQAGNVAFRPSTTYNGRFVLYGVYDGSSFTCADGLGTYITGSTDLDTSVDYVGVANTGSGDVGVRPDGSVVLPDGSVVYPNAQTGEYPWPVELNPDWWKTLSELLSRDATNDDTKTDTQIINLNLDGIRAQIASILDYIKQGFWVDFKTFWLDFFKVDTSKLNPNTYSQYGVADRFLRWADALFYGLTGQHLSSQGG